jgi:hypothetical protein
MTPRSQRPSALSDSRIGACRRIVARPAVSIAGRCVRAFGFEARSRARLFQESS